MGQINVIEEEEEYIENLYILPPKVLNNNKEEEKLKLKLPPLRIDEPISSIKAVLSEVIGYAHITNYRLVLEKHNNDNDTIVMNNKTKNNKNKTKTTNNPILINDLIYKYTSKSNIVSK